MPLYELGLILDPEAPPEEETALLEKMEAIILEGGGEMVDKDARGRRELAYPIRKKTHGMYHFWKFDVDGQLLPKLGFELRTSEVVIRSLVLNLDNEMRRVHKRKRKDAKKAAAKVAKAEAKAAAAVEDS